MTNLEDERYMMAAIEQAKRAFERGEVPVGAVAVFEGKIVAEAHNLVEQSRDASAHAEMLCLRATAKSLGRWRLQGVTLYSTLEPCPMCAGALLSFRIDRLVWGAEDNRLGADGSFIPFLEMKHPMHSLEIERGVLRVLSSKLMKEFFALRRAGSCLNLS